MAQATRIKGGKVRVLLETSTPGVYAAPCGFTSKTVTFTKNLEDVQVPDCDDPDKVDWLGRDAVSLAMSVSGEGVLAEESIVTWVEAWESIDSIKAKVEMEFPSKTLTWTGKMHVDNMEAVAPNGRSSTATFSLQSDGEMVRTMTPAS